MLSRVDDVLHVTTVSKKRMSPSKKSVERHRDRSTPVVEDIRHRPLLTVVDERSQIGLILRGIQL